MKIKQVLRDVCLVFIFTFFGGVIVGLAIGGPPNIKNPRFIAAGIVANSFLAVAAYCIAGCLTRVDRFKHLSIVVLISWLLSAVNMLVMPGLSIVSWFSGLFFGFLYMLIGGALSLLFVPNESKASADAHAVSGPDGPSAGESNSPDS